MEKNTTIKERAYKPQWTSCWVRVQPFGGKFKAASNDYDTTIVIDLGIGTRNDGFGYRDTWQEAQQDLDVMAKECRWAEVHMEVWEQQFEK